MKEGIKKGDVNILSWFLWQGNIDCLAWIGNNVSILLKEKIKMMFIFPQIGMD